MVWVSDPHPPDSASNGKRNVTVIDVFIFVCFLLLPSEAIYGEGTVMVQESKVMASAAAP